jgi:hypothetical protein
MTMVLKLVRLSGKIVEYYQLIEKNAVTRGKYFSIYVAPDDFVEKYFGKKNTVFSQ